LTRLAKWSIILLLRKKYMQITKCDICKKKIEFKDTVRVHKADSAFSSFEFCGNCATPIVKFLISKKLIDKKNEKK